MSAQPSCLSLQKPEAIFFDWDGTLADSFSFLQAAHNHVLETLELPAFSGDWFTPYFGQPREEIYPKIYAERAGEAQPHFEAFVVENHQALLKPIARAQILLDTIKAQNIMAGIVTNKRSDFVAAEIAAFGWANRFSSVVGAGEASIDKPDGAPLILALERAGYKGSLNGLWYVGDTKIDYLCARAVGCTFIYLAHEHLNHDWLDPNPSFMVVKNLDELKRTLDEAHILEY